MERPPDSLKSFGNRIARAASQSGAPELIRFLRIGGLQGGATGISDLYAAGDTQSRNPDHVGIWERKVENGKACYVRRMDAMGEWHFWANLGRIEAKGVKRRVVLIGESVARGYLYDPEFAPAFALEKILEPHFGDNGVEVIDLARTNLGYQVSELAISALQLQPDIVIIFAGNNWGRSAPEPSEITEIAEALSQEGVAGVKRICETQIERNARRILNEIASTYERRRVPLVWIVPEFNLGDWRDQVTNLPHLGKGLNREWLNSLAEAQSSLHAGDLSKARELANRMIEIDKGLCNAGFYILAGCSKQANDIDGERKYLELARDTMVWDLSRTPIPRTYGVAQAVLREEARRHKYQLIDLPVVFKEYLGGELPGRRLFHDYCHLTTEGIQVAMSAAAECVLRALKGVEKPWQTLVAHEVAPAPEIEAEALFLAAILNAHYTQAYDVVHYFCARALRCSPHVAELMLHYLDFQHRRLLPRGASKSEEQMARLGSSLMQRYLLRLSQKRLEKLLFDAIVNALEETGIDARESVEQLRREEHSVVSGEIDLLDFYYCSAAGQEQELAWVHPTEESWYQPDAHYYRAYWPESRFVFIGEAGRAVTLSLTCRLPGSATEKVAIEVNGKPQVEIVVDERWSSWTINVDGQVVRDGVNEIAVRWPVIDFDHTGWIESVRQSVCERKFPEFYPIFGEIHSFTAFSPKHAPENISAVEELTEVVA